MNVKLKYNIEGPAYDVNLLKARGIEDVGNFLSPSEDNIINPFKLDNMKEAVQKMIELVGTRTLVIVDSDCDGQCASAILINYLKELYPNWQLDYFIHERKNHGLEDVVDSDRVNIDDYSLVIIPDAGSNDDIYFNAHPNIQFIVLDHHEREENRSTLPQNVILVNNQLSNDYDNKWLSGAGVTWQFCRAMDSMLMNDNKADKYMDLAAVAIIGDVMNITSLENRAIITKGLDNINNRFLRLLVDNSAYQIGEEITPIGIAFYVVPLINSMCRMGSISEKERMFLALIDPCAQVECHKRGVAKGTMVDVAIESVRECTNTKAKQKRIQEKMAELCEQQILENNLLENKILIIELGEEFDDIPSEMNGLAATKISNDYKHPTLIGRVNSEGILQGSIRGLSTIDMQPLKEFLESSGYFTFLAGHSLAAGFGISVANISKFLKWSNEQLQDIDMNNNTWYVDFKLKGSNSEIGNIISHIDSLKCCWGQGMSEPLICVEDITFGRADTTVMGKNTDTVKIMKNGIAYMFFKRTLDEIKELTRYSNAIISLVGTANMNEWNGRYTPQIFVNDYVVKDNTYGF